MRHTTALSIPTAFTTTMGHFHTGHCKNYDFQTSHSMNLFNVTRGSSCYSCTKGFLNFEGYIFFFLHLLQEVIKMLSRKGAPPAAQGQERPGSTRGADGHMGTQSCRGAKGGAVSCYRATALNTHPNGPTGHPGLCLCPHHNLPPGPAASPLLCRHRRLSALSLPLWGHANQHSQDLVGACTPGPRAPRPPTESVGLS